MKEMEESFELDKAVFFKKLEKRIENFCNKLNDYLKEPNDKNIHDIRVSIRRLEVAFRILPRAARKKESIQNYTKQAKALFKLNAEIRDFDIICAKLESNYQQDAVDLVRLLKERREGRLKIANRLASKISNVQPPKIAQNTIKKRKLNKRYRKILDEIELNIQKNSVIALMDEKKVEELHMLRKELKKLRYSLELYAKKEELDLLKNLKNIQDILGEIHDSDIIIDYLESLKQHSKLSHIINSEIVERSKKYQMFVSTFKETKSKLKRLGL